MFVDRAMRDPSAILPLTEAAVAAEAARQAHRRRLWAEATREPEPTRNSLVDRLATRPEPWAWIW